MTFTHTQQFTDANQPITHVYGLEEETPETLGELANSMHIGGTELLISNIIVIFFAS